MCSYELNGEVVVVLAFKTAYTLVRKRRDNDKKIISLFIGMKDMMGVLLLYVMHPSSRTHSCPAASRAWRMTSLSHRMA
jgi:hypothetical protein